MIFEKNCLFLFNDDLKTIYREHSDVLDSKDLSLSCFKYDDIEKFKKNVSESRLIAYINSDKKEIFYIEDQKYKGTVEKY
jgi:hypothetical protein